MKGTEPAYPIFLQEGLSHNSHVDCGISTRLYLAGMAMQGLCVGKITSEIKKGECVDIAEMALLIADELIKQEEATRCLGE